MKNIFIPKKNHLKNQKKSRKKTRKGEISLMGKVCGKIKRRKKFCNFLEF